MNTFKKLSLAVIAALMLFSLFAASFSPAAAATIPNCTQWHVVKSGDTLTKIAQQYNTTVAKLIEINELENPNLIYVGQNLCISTNGTTGGTPAPSLPNTSSGIRVSASSVVEDQSVTLSGKSLVASTAYSIYLSNYKANLPVNYLIGTVTTKSDGTFTGTYKLPSKLADVSKIKVMITNNKGDIASNWFYNITSSGNVGGISSPAVTLTIVSVDEGESVKIQASNLLPGVTYEVLMDKTGTGAEEGILVGTIKSTNGNSVTTTFEIPTELEGRSKIDLRVQSDTYETEVFITFENDK
ncbi:MAG: hypothetical protein Fur0022_49200 [Anaerolineales bacterium]